MLGDKKYSDYVIEMLNGYVALFPKLPLHPDGKSYSPGKFFWQGLNDAAWLIHVVQAYDCVFPELSEVEKEAV